MITVKKDAIKFKDSDGSMKSTGMLCEVGISSGIVPTEFHNLLKDESVIIYPNCRISTSKVGTIEEVNGAFVLEFVLPANTTPLIRARGYIPNSIYVNFSRDGETWTVAYIHPGRCTIDEYGDLVYAFTAGVDPIGYDRIIRINLCLGHVSANAISFTEENIRDGGAIVTLNEPIGIVVPDVAQ